MKRPIVMFGDTRSRENIALLQARGWEQAARLWEQRSCDESCPDCTPGIIREAMVLALKEAEKVIREHEHCEERPAMCALHILERIASLRKILAVGAERKDLEGK